MTTTHRNHAASALLLIGCLVQGSGASTQICENTCISPATGASLPGYISNGVCQDQYGQNSVGSSCTCACS